MTTREPTSSCSDSPSSFIRTFESQFQGISFPPFSYQDHEQTLDSLLKEIDRNISQTDKQFLLSFKLAEPDWELDQDYQPLKSSPAIQRKLINTNKLKDLNPEKHQDMLNALDKSLQH